MAKKSDLEVGQRVRFRRSHDRNVELTGSIVKIHETDDCVDVETEPDGKIAEVSTIETAHISDLTPIADVTPIAATDYDGIASADVDNSEEGTGTKGRRKHGRG